MKNLKNIAMLIDADNTQLSKLESVIQEISTIAASSSNVLTVTGAKVLSKTGKMN